MLANCISREFETFYVYELRGYVQLFQILCTGSTLCKGSAEGCEHTGFRVLLRLLDRIFYVWRHEFLINEAY